MNEYMGDKAVAYAERMENRVDKGSYKEELRDAFEYGYMTALYNVCDFMDANYSIDKEKLFNVFKSEFL